MNSSDDENENRSQTYLEFVRKSSRDLRKLAAESQSNNQQEEIESKKSSEFISPHFGPSPHKQKEQKEALMMSCKSELEGFSDWHSNNDVIEPQHNPSTRNLYHKNANKAPTPLHIIKE